MRVANTVTAPRGNVLAPGGGGPHIRGMHDITLNGAAHPIPSGLSVARLLASLGLPLQKVAVERNAAIVPRSTYEQTLLTPGDQVEIVHFIGGG